MERKTVIKSLQNTNLSAFEPTIIEYFHINKEVNSLFFGKNKSTFFFLNQSEDKINRIACFQKNKWHKILLVQTIRSSYHGVESTPFLYEITYFPEKTQPPTIRLYHFEHQSLKLLFIQPMEEIKKSRELEIYESFKDTPVKISLELYYTSKQTAFAIKDVNDRSLFTETSAEIIKNTEDRFLSYLDCMFSTASFMNVDSVTAVLAQKLVSSKSMQKKALEKLAGNQKNFDILFKYRHKLHLEYGPFQIKKLLEEALLKGLEVNLENAEEIDSTSSLYILNRNGEKSLHMVTRLIFCDLAEIQAAFEKLNQAKTLHPDASRSVIEFILEKEASVSLDHLQSPADSITFAYMENNDKIHYDTFDLIPFQKAHSLHRLHPYYFEAFELFRYSNFTLIQDDTHSSPVNIFIYASAKQNVLSQAKTNDNRLIACSFVMDSSFENHLSLLCSDMEKTMESYPLARRPFLNRIVLQAIKHVDLSEIDLINYIEKHRTQLRRLRIEKVLLKYYKEHVEQMLEVKNILGDTLITSTICLDRNNRQQCISTASKIEARELQIVSKGGVWAYRIPLLIESMAAEFRKQRLDTPYLSQEIGFIELDLDHSQTVIHPTTGSIDYNYGELMPVDRLPGHNEAGVVIGIKTDDLALGIPVRRLLIIGDLSHSSRGAIRGQECIRINAAIRYAASEKIPIDWYAASFGVQVHRERGVEGLDAAASTIREIVTNCHRNGVQINFIIDEANIGAQSYWDSMGAIVYDTSGILIMTPNGCMALTGPKALACALYSTVSSENISKYTDALYPQGLQSLSGHMLVHGPNSDSMLFAKDLEEASQFLLLHHYYSYLHPAEKIASRRCHMWKQSATEDRQLLQKEMDNFLKGLKPNRRCILDYLRDFESPSPLEFWADSKGIRKQIPKNGDLPQEASTIVQEMLIGGQPTLVIFTPTGPLTPADAGIIARAIYKASARLQLLIIGSLSGFSCDPLSMENRQLLEGALIAKAIVEHKGPILICNLGSLVGGTFVVFNKQLHQDLRILAIEGARVQVIGGKSAAKVVFHTSICKQADQDSRIIKSVKIQANATIQKITQETLKGSEISPIELRIKVISEIEDKEGVLFDQFHNAQRAMKVKSIDQIVSFTTLKESIISNFEEMRMKYILKEGHHFDSAA